MEEEKKEPTLEELYAPPTSTDKPRLDKRRTITVGFVMDLVFTGFALFGLLLCIVSDCIMNSRGGACTDFSEACAFFSALLTLSLPWIAVPLRFVTALITIPTRRASLKEVYSFVAYIAATFFAFVILMSSRSWDLLMSV